MAVFRPGNAFDGATIVGWFIFSNYICCFEYGFTGNDGGMPKRIGADIERKWDTPRQMFGFAITRLRTLKNQSQFEVASAVGCAEGYLRSIEQGKENFTFDLEYAIVDYFEMLPMSKFWAYAEDLAAREFIPIDS
jgi:DNA-binding XRE family transcriptional regulator